MLRREISNLKMNKLDTSECKNISDIVVPVKQFMKEDNNILTAVKARMEDIRQELIAMQEQPSMDYEPKLI
jgi:hypothetical protein